METILQYKFRNNHRMMSKRFNQSKKFRVSDKSNFVVLYRIEMGSQMRRVSLFVSSDAITSASREVGSAIYFYTIVFDITEPREAS